MGRTRSTNSARRIPRWERRGRRRRPGIGGFAPVHPDESAPLVAESDRQKLVPEGLAQMGPHAPRLGGSVVVVGPEQDSMLGAAPATDPFHVLGHGFTTAPLVSSPKVVLNGQPQVLEGHFVVLLAHQRFVFVPHQEEPIPGFIERGPASGVVLGRLIVVIRGRNANRRDRSRSGQGNSVGQSPCRPRPGPPRGGTAEDCRGGTRRRWGEREVGSLEAFGVRVKPWPDFRRNVFG